MATTDYFILGDHNAGRAHVDQALRELGFQVTVTGPDVWKAKRGSQAATLLLGGLAGKSQLMKFTVQFFNDNGLLVARLGRTSGSGAMGGAIGVARSNSTFVEIDTDLTNRLAALGVLHNVVRAA